MANTIGTPTVTDFSGTAQFQGLWDRVIAFTATISDQDAVTANDTITFSLTVTGAALGDLVLVAANNDLLDGGGDGIVLTGTVSAADTVAIRVHADGTEYAADDLNSAVVKGVVLSPAWA